MELKVRDDFALTSIRSTDKSALVEHLNDLSISDVIPVLPYPYTEAMADWWIKHRLEFVEETGVEISFCLRNPEGYMIGSFGVDDFKVGANHRAEIGYWLASSYRGRGLAVDALRVFVHYAFDTLQIIKFSAHTLEFNAASAKVLEKCRFRLEGRLRQHTKTRNGIYDTLAYGLLKTD